MWKQRAFTNLIHLFADANVPTWALNEDAKLLNASTVTKHETTAT